MGVWTLNEFINEHECYKCSIAVLPCINHLQEFSTIMASKPPPYHFRPCNRNLRLPNREPPSDRQTNVVYKIPCADCIWNYVGETGRCLHTRKKQHIQNTKVFKSGSNMPKGHTIDFENACVIDKGNSHVRKMLGSWHTAITSQTDNNSKQLPRQYSI